MPRGHFLAINLLIAVFSLSCTAQRQLYPGEARHPSSIAIIRLDPEAERTKVLQIGENKVRGEIWYVLPGDYHVVTMAKRRAPVKVGQDRENYHVYITAVCKATFLARPGGRYIATSKGSYSRYQNKTGHAPEYQGSVAAWIADEASPGEPAAHTKCEITADDVFQSMISAP
jgi:hypothetical protein